MRPIDLVALDQAATPSDLAPVAYLLKHKASSLYGMRCEPLNQLHSERESALVVVLSLTLTSANTPAFPSLLSFRRLGNP